MSKKDNILESWIMVEHLSEGDINLKDKSIITFGELEDSNYYDLLFGEIQKETGKQIKKLLMESGYTVKDVQSAMGFENPQAVYKWISGRSLPSLDNIVILSRLLHTSIEDILVVDGDIVRFRGICIKLPVQ